MHLSSLFERARSRFRWKWLTRALGVLCLVLAFPVGALSVNAAQDCYREDLIAEWGAPAAGVLVVVGVFLLARNPWLKYGCSVVAGIAVFVVFLFVVIAVGVSNCI